MPKGDPVAAFLELYATGKTSEALRLMYPTPDVRLDDYDALDPAYRPIVNFIDACTFGDDTQAYYCCDELIKSLQSGNNTLAFPRGLLERLYNDRQVLRMRRLNPKDFEEAIHEPMIHGLSQSLLTYLICETDAILLSKKEIADSCDSFPEELQSDMLNYALYAHNWTRFRLEGPNYYNDLNWLYLRAQRPPLCRTYFHHSYPSNLQVSITLGEGEVPVLFMDALDLDWKSILEPIQEHPAIFVFPSKYALSHCMAMDAILDSIVLPQHACLTLDAYPREQFLAQGTRKMFSGMLKPISLHENTLLKENETTIIGILQEFLAEDPHADGKRQQLSNWLYRLGKAIRFGTDLKRLGRNRYLAFQEYWRESELYDYFKDAPPANVTIPHYGYDYEKEILDQTQPIGPKRSVSVEKPLRIAHILPQIIDGNHASSRILRTLCQHHDRKHFQPYIYVTEKLVPRPMHYPVNDRMICDSSQRRAPQDIANYKAMGIPVYIDPADANFQDTAQRLAKKLAEDHIDVAILHGPDPVNNLLTRLSEVPYSVFIEHGVVPEQAGYQLIILSTKEAAKELKDKYEAMGSTVIGLPFAVDIREGWDDAPYPKSYFGLKEEHRVLTTISNHLKERLTKDVCWAIAEILKRNPNAYYVPMGPMDDTQHVYKNFTDAGVSDRVWPIGLVPNASQVARSADLYLNEFPIGSCLGLLDAMASGCPPVSMYDATGPTASKYGGAYFDINKSITNGSKEEYVELACALLNDDTMYAEWSELAKQRYEELCNPEAYVMAIESAIASHLT